MNARSGAHDNTAYDWKTIMNHPYVITLDQMPGWANYSPTALGARAKPISRLGMGT